MSTGATRSGAAAGTPGAGAMRALRGQERKPPPLMDPTRERDSRRILRLFRPYRARLTVVLVMIVFSAGISMLQPFLLRDALDEGLLNHDQTVLTVTVLGMIAIALVSQATSVWQTYLSNVVGQRVMHDLRAAVYHRLQQMSLAFFTRTRTGEVQSRIANDIGGLDNVVTSTATTIASNVTTVIGGAGRDVPARLAARADLACVRAAVGVGDPASREDPAPDHHRAAATVGRHERAGRRVAVGVGDHARQDDGPRRRPRRPFHGRIEGRSPTWRSGRGWRAAG